MQENFIFKQATEPWEFEAIHGLNYRTFVEEIAQHPQNSEKRLVDKYHLENTYFIAITKQPQAQLIAMVCLRSVRPFSVELKLQALGGAAYFESLLPNGKSLCEIRLLAIEPAYRHSKTILGLLQNLAQYAHSQHFDLGLISGTTRQLRLYKKLGFIPFGPLVGSAEAPYQPMYLSLVAFLRTTTPVLHVPVLHVQSKAQKPF